MKIYILVFTLLILSGCVSQATSVSEVSKTAQPTPTIENSNLNSNSQISYSDYQYDSALLDKLNSENERFRVVPEEFKSVDFKNFKYGFGRLKNGEIEDKEPNNPLAGSQSFSLEDVFYIDLVGDSKKEAVVFIYTVGCGASCDGGSDAAYFYSSDQVKARLIDIFDTGANAGGCSLKSFTIKNKKIYAEQFGKCLKNTIADENKEFLCKFCIKDETHRTFSLSTKGLKQESIQVFDTNQVNVMNSPAIISIND